MAAGRAGVAGASLASETPDGHVRLRAPLTYELAETLPRWGRSLAPVAEKVVHILGRAMEGRYTP